MSEIRVWSETAGDNTAASPHGAPEGWVGGDVNGWGREVMAQVRTWYESSEWVDTIYSVSPAGYTLTKFSDTVVYVVGKNVVASLPDGSWIRVTGSGGTFVMKITGTPIFNVGNTEVTIEGGVVPAVPTKLEMYSAQEPGGFMWGGQGTEAARNVLYPGSNGIPDNVVWYATDTGQTYIGTGGAWVEFPAGELDGESSESFVQNENSSLAEASALQTIKSELTIEAALIGETTINAVGVSSSDVSVDAPALNVVAGGIARGGMAANAADTASIQVIDSSSDLAVECQFGEDGSIQVKDVNAGNAFSPLLGTYFSVDADSFVDENQWDQLTHSTGTGTFTYPLTPDGVRRFKVEMWIFGEQSGDNAELAAIAWCSGANGDIDLDPMYIRGTPGVPTGVSATIKFGPSDWYLPHDKEDAVLVYGSGIVVPSASHVGSLGAYCRAGINDTDVLAGSYVLITPLRG